MRKLETKRRPRQASPYAASVKAPPAGREPTAVIAELMQKRPRQTRSREEQAFIDLQRGSHQ